MLINPLPLLSLVLCKTPGLTLSRFYFMFLLIPIHLHVLFSGDWAYVCAFASRPQEEFGFIPASYCRPLTPEEIESSQRRMVTFAVDHQLSAALDLANSSSSSAMSSYRSSPLPTANPYHILATYSNPAKKKSPSPLAANEANGCTQRSSASSRNQAVDDVNGEFPNRQRWPSSPNESEYPYQAVVQYTFNEDCTASSEHASVHRGEVVTVLGKDGSEWVWIVSASGRKGLIPTCFVSQLATQGLSFLINFFSICSCTARF